MLSNLPSAHFNDAFPLRHGASNRLSVILIAFEKNVPFLGSLYLLSPCWVVWICFLSSGSLVQGKTVVLFWTSTTNGTLLAISVAARLKSVLLMETLLKEELPEFRILFYCNIHPTYTKLFLKPLSLSSSFTPRDKVWDFRNQYPTYAENEDQNHECKN